ncbi:MAG TPA: hypothetical protein VE131_05895 [Terriglobales bacterium]|nr:hypothetical protein [Terriglobales bacterium]
MKACNRWRDGFAVDRLAMPPVTSPAYEARISAVPALGEHSERIFGELGQSSGDIAALREGGVV